ncbi:hypothetical protein AgCh_031520 [Apium graveolens]
MDWLSSNGAQIDYKGKKVKIQMPNGKEIVIKGQRQTQKFLNIVQAKKLLRKDSKAYLAYVAGTKREAPIDASHKGLGCMLMQHGKVVAYASWQLKEYEASVVADALSSKERLKMLTTPEELVRELEEIEIEVKSLGQECQAIQSLIETSQDRRVDLGIREPPARKTTSMDQTRTVVLRRVRNAREFRRLFVRQPRQVALVDGLKHNLLSISQLCDKGNSVTFNSEACVVTNKRSNKVVLTGVRKGNVYLADFNSSNVEYVTYLLSKASQDESWLWHKKLSHLNFKTINELVKKELVRGIPLVEFSKDGLCDACQKGKQIKASSRKKLDSTIEEPLQVNNHPDFKVKRIRSDNGTEFKNSVMRAFYEENGILHEFQQQGHHNRME